MTDEHTTIREYREYRVDGIDTAQQIRWDLKGTFGYRAVARRALDTDEIQDWYVYHPEANEIACYWPDYFEEPVWKKHNSYAFYNPLADFGDNEPYAYFTLHEWPDELDQDAEVFYG